MKEFVLEGLLNTEGLDFTILVLNNVVSMALAFFIMYIDKITYTGTSYSKKFNVSLGMITIIKTSIMCVISNNVALSLGMVGALSIIRFRTAVKDVRDSAFIFWAISVGIGCGVSQFALVGIGSLFLMLFMFLTRQVKEDNQKLLIIRGQLQQEEAVEKFVEKCFDKKLNQSVFSATEDSFELIYEISTGTLSKAKQQGNDVVKELMTVHGVYSVNLIDQADEIGH